MRRARGAHPDGRDRGDIPAAEGPATEAAGPGGWRTGAGREDDGRGSVRQREAGIVREVGWGAMTDDQYAALNRRFDAMSQQLESFQQSVNDRFDAVDSRLKAVALDIRIIKMAVAPGPAEMAIRDAMRGFRDEDQHVSP
jgi:hypothetical protein